MFVFFICAVESEDQKSNAATGKSVFELNDKTCIFTFSLPLCPQL